VVSPMVTPSVRSAWCFRFPGLWGMACFVLVRSRVILQEDPFCFVVSVNVCTEVGPVREAFEREFSTHLA